MTRTQPPANLSVAVTSSCTFPGSNAVCPASATIFRSASGQALDNAIDALETASEKKDVVENFSETVTSSHQEAENAFEDIETALQDAQELGEDVDALKAKRDEADAAYQLLTTAADAAEDAYEEALGVDTGDLQTAVDLVLDERQKALTALNDANSALSNAEQYQGNQVQQDAYERTAAA